MDLLVNLGWVLLGVTALYFGAEWLVKGSSKLALRVGISPLVVGLTVVAFGTSAPELLVSVSANLKDGGGDIALGNVVGSNICNIALVLGLAALLRPFPVHGQVIRRDMPILLGATVVFVLMLLDGQVQRWEGAVLAGGVILYTVSSIISGRKEGGADDTSELELSEEEIAAAKSGGLSKALFDFGLIVLGLGVLVIGTNRLLFGGSEIAVAFGVPPAVIALSLVAFGTSLPEVATVVVASLKGEGDLVTGNAVGSCIFNILAVVGITGCIASLSRDSLKMEDLWIMSGILVVSYVFMLTKRRFSRIEGGILLGAYLIYVIWLFLRQS